jgi:hypothetical protein
MYGFFSFIVQPLLEAAHPRNIVEIGACEGEHTVRLLEWCKKRQCLLHSIDPKPMFDVSQLTARFPENFKFYQARSLDVLGQIERPDVVLIDGDHNWYTVYHELSILLENQRQGFPLVLLHDVAWPFDRRDAYYDPSSIPAEHRKPYTLAGIDPKTGGLWEGQGLAAGLAKALSVDGPRNGVRTAVDDFIRERAPDMRFEVVPADFGLGILTTPAFQTSYPAVQQFLDALSTIEFARSTVAHLEERRLEDLHEQRQIMMRQELQYRTSLARALAEASAARGACGDSNDRMNAIELELLELRTQLVAARLCATSTYTSLLQNLFARSVVLGAKCLRVLRRLAVVALGEWHGWPK